VVPPRTIGKILKKAGLVRKYRVKKIKYKYLRAEQQPGELVEIDVKHVPGKVAGKRSACATLSVAQINVWYSIKMRKIIISPGEYYHVYNRGNNKQEIFKNDHDRARLLFSLLGLQSELVLKNISRLVSNFVHKKSLTLENDDIVNIAKKRYVDLVNFSLMPNHFHLILFERQAGGISRYMQRVLNSYTKYFNTRHEKHGHLFGGTYRAVHIEDNEQLLYASAYVHRNCNALPKWAGRSSEYPWSSYQDFATKNRWGELLVQTPILEQFASRNEYYEWVETSGAKDREWEFYLPDTVQH